MSAKPVPVLLFLAGTLLAVVVDVTVGKPDRSGCGIDDQAALLCQLLQQARQAQPGPTKDKVLQLAQGLKKFSSPPKQTSNNVFESFMRKKSASLALEGALAMLPPSSLTLQEVMQGLRNTSSVVDFLRGSNACSTLGSTRLVAHATGVLAAELLPTAIALVVAIRSTGSVVHCELDPTLPTRLPHPMRYGIGAALYNSAALAPWWIIETTRLALALQRGNERGSGASSNLHDGNVSGSRWLGRSAGQHASAAMDAEPVVHVSVYESGSTDKTPYWSEVFGSLLSVLGIRHTLVTHGSIFRTAYSHRIQFLAALRNAVMAPLLSDPSGAPDRVFFINDIYFCHQDLFRLAHYPVGTDLVCGLDYYDPNTAGATPTPRPTAPSSSSSPSSGEGAGTEDGSSSSSRLQTSGSATLTGHRTLETLALRLQEYVIEAGRDPSSSHLGEWGAGGRAAGDEATDAEGPAAHCSAAEVAQQLLSSDAAAAEEAEDELLRPPGRALLAQHYVFQVYMMRERHRLMSEPRPTSMYFFYDIWVARDTTGERFDPFVSGAPGDASPWRHAKTGFPYVVHCCWNGVAMFNATYFTSYLEVEAPGEAGRPGSGSSGSSGSSRRRHLPKPMKFRYANLPPTYNDTTGTFMPGPDLAGATGTASQHDMCDYCEASLMCDDMWKRGARAMLVDPSVRVAYKPWVHTHMLASAHIPKQRWAAVRAFVAPGGPLERIWQARQRDTWQLVECCPLIKGQNGAWWDRCFMQNISVDTNQVVPYSLKSMRIYAKASPPPPPSTTQPLPVLAYHQQQQQQQRLQPPPPPGDQQQPT